MANYRANVGGKRPLHPIRYDEPLASPERDSEIRLDTYVCMLNSTYIYLYCTLHTSLQKPKSIDQAIKKPHRISTKRTEKQCRLDSDPIVIVMVQK